jgi:hypothetical protein
MNLRYAILHHTDWPGHTDHYDLLLQTEMGESDDDRVLLTFSTLDDEFPSDGALFKKNAPHRRFFLAYEGLVSAGRGRVMRVDAGACQAESHSNFILSGGRLNGRAALIMRAGGTFVLRLT